MTQKILIVPHFYCRFKHFSGQDQKADAEIPQKQMSRKQTVERKGSNQKRARDMGASLDTDSDVAAQQIALMSVDNPSIRDSVPQQQAEKSDRLLNGLLYIPGYAVGVFISLRWSSATANLITSLSTLTSTGIIECVVNLSLQSRGYHLY